MIHSHNIFDFIPMSESLTVNPVPINGVPANVLSIYIAPGKELPAHTSDVPVLIYILEGEGEYFQSDEVLRVQKGTLIECEAHVLHSLKPLGDSSLKIMVTKILV